MSCFVVRTNVVRNGSLPRGANHEGRNSGIRGL